MKPYLVLVSLVLLLAVVRVEGCLGEVVPQGARPGARARAAAALPPLADRRIPRPGMHRSRAEACDAGCRETRFLGHFVVVRSINAGYDLAGGKRNPARLCRQRQSHSSAPSRQVHVPHVLIIVQQLLQQLPDLQQYQALVLTSSHLKQ